MMEQPAFLRMKVVLARSGLSRTTLYRKISSGTFPRQIPLGPRVVGWRADEFELWCRDPAAYHANRE
ncbi:AlpA family phage regulatory protein [Novosphingobium resinovorum]|nr:MULTISPECIES: AlpA family phage regulatory protein [Novosphingobium]MBF7014133.1 AlpA family phage regulatory protein [Novosphingobium sp. HR1a]WJM26271.1 AlpA family phage regulatory protein [Novosphingobium resinovorum]